MFPEHYPISKVYNKKSEGVVSLKVNISFPSALYFLQNDRAPEPLVFSSEIAQNNIFMMFFFSTVLLLKVEK